MSSYFVEEFLEFTCLSASNLIWDTDDLRGSLSLLLVDRACSKLYKLFQSGQKQFLKYRSNTLCSMTCI